MLLDNRNNFWVVSAPGLRSLLVYSDVSIQNEETTLDLDVFDCDGERCNQARIEFSTKRQCFFELDPLLATLKRQAGFVHGMVSLRGAADMSRTMIRYQSTQASFLSATNNLLSRSRPQAIPVHAAEGRTVLLVIANTEEFEVSVRGRLLVGKRSPECAWTLKPRASRIIDLTSTFSAIISEDPSSMLGRGYLRLSTTADHGVITRLVIVSQAEDGTESMHFY
jgi:hypothetical protein